MGLFKKKVDPISERARALNDQIAELESQIAKLSDKLQTEAEQPPSPPEPEKPPESSSPAQPLPGMPRLRSTAFPHSQVVVHSGNADPVFEEVPNNPFKGNGNEEPPEPENDIGVRKGTLAEMWQRMQNNLRGPPASNPKLVSYLAAGSIQGLRPLRYEKRVARNRFIALVILLIAVLWGLLAFFLKR